MAIQQERFNTSPIELSELYDNSTYWQQLQATLGTTNTDHRKLLRIKDLEQIVAAANIPLKAHGNEARIPGGGLPENLNPYLIMAIAATGGPRGPIGLQFIAQKDKEKGGWDPNHLSYDDSLNESLERPPEAHETIVDKYKNRVLFFTTGVCAAYCRFCTRGDRVGKERPKTTEEIDKGFEWIRNNSRVREIIFSGGDPLVLPKPIFSHIIGRLRELQEEDRLDSVRFGSRALIHRGELPQFYYDELRRLKNRANVMLHVNHASEITQEVADGMDKFMDVGRAKLYSQTVLLAGVNDDRETMKQLLTKFQKYGGTPYYIFTCDPVNWGTHFKVPFEKIFGMFHQLRAEMPGLAGNARVVIDVPGGHGKIALPEGFWASEQMPREFTDFEGRQFYIDQHSNVLPVPKQNASNTPQETTVFQSAADYD